jgi:outer membrane protein assembly factor BamB
MDLAPVIAHDDVIAIHDGRLISFDTVQGSIRWQVASQFTGQPSLAFDQIYAVDNGHLVVLDELTHAELWSWQAPAGALAGPMIVTDTHLFASTAQTVYAVDLATHQSVWSYPVAGHLALSEGTLYVAAADGTLTAFSSPLASPAPYGSVLP